MFLLLVIVVVLASLPPCTTVSFYVLSVLKYVVFLYCSPRLLSSKMNITASFFSLHFSFSNFSIHKRFPSFIYSLSPLIRAPKSAQINVYNRELRTPLLVTLVCSAHTLSSPHWKKTQLQNVPIFPLPTNNTRLQLID
jgi:hypothetical protein